MKKNLIFILFLAIVTLGAIAVNAQNLNENELTSSTSQLTASTTTSNKVYYYNDYQDLISQIYEDVYSDIYQEIYNDIMLDINEEFQDEIYNQVVLKANQFIEENEILVYVDDFQQQIYDVIDIADKSAFGVLTYAGSEPVATGSGVVYKYSSSQDLYYLITNEHVVAEGNNYSVVFSDGSEYVANLIGYDTEVDIAILTFRAADKIINPSVLGVSSTLKKGMIMLSAGNPQGFDFYGSITLGIVSGLERKLDSNQYIDYVQHDSAINPGNSGGPLYNLNGEVIGINVSKLADTEIEGMGFALPIDLVKRIINRIEEGSLTANTIMPRIGAKYYDIKTYYDNGQVSVKNLIINGNVRSDEITLDLPQGVQTGFLIYNIITDGSLDDTVLKSGDIIYQINDFVVTSEEDYFEYIYSNYESGDMISISYYSLNHNSLEYGEELSTIVVELK
ncbi:MAG: trypsin-like peptidase domain-containing protein [Candidatus Izemoplasmatales bacterium]|nr:trypsin-like peptidase domain-containing protein [Candidatus Izemoplasmatales bacterium]